MKKTVGHAKTKIVNSCRDAIKTNNIASLFKIMSGKSIHQ